MIARLLVSAFLMINIINVSAQENDFDKDVMKFLEVNGSKQTLAPVVDQIISQFRMMKSAVPESFWIELKADLLVDLSTLNQKMAPVYKKHFTHEEIKGLIIFFESPLGKSYTTKSAALLPETMQIGQQWGMEIAGKVQQKLSAKGY